ncbi:unnamed protein product, partial [marine sediment metagenome]
TISIFTINNSFVKKVILEIIEKIPEKYSCKQCHQALRGAEV